MRKEELLKLYEEIKNKGKEPEMIFLYIHMPTGETETIINPNVKEKIEYIDRTYDDDLVHANCKQIYIEEAYIYEKYESGMLFAEAYEMMKKGVMDEIKTIFKPEFLNRIDDIIVFHQLNNENMKEIVNLLASNLYKRCEDQLGIHLTITAALKEHLVSKYADNKMGARPLKRAIQSVVEDALAEEILQKKVVPGDKVSAGFKDGKVVFTVKN